MNCRKGRWRPLQDAMWLLVAVATVSMVITLHLGNMTWFGSKGVTQFHGVRSSHFNQDLQHLTIQRSISNLKHGFVNSALHNDLAAAAKGKPQEFPGQGDDVADGAEHVGNSIVDGDVFSGPPQVAKDGKKAMTDLDISRIKGLYDTLSQIESSALTSPADEVKVVVRGSLSSVKHHLPLIESAFHKHKASVTYEAPESLSTPSTGSDMQGDNWSIIMCLNTTFKGEDCVVTARHLTQGSTKVNVIPELNDVLMSPDLLCDTRQKTVEQQDKQNVAAGRWCGGDLPCHINTVADVVRDSSCDGVSGWWLVRGQESEMPGQFFPCHDTISLLGNLSQSSSNNVVVSLPHNLLTLDGAEPLVWQVEVLVTSLLPPRVYLHPDGLAWEGLQEFVYRKHQKNVSLLDLRQLITELHSEATAGSTLAQTEITLIQMIRLLEHHVRLHHSQQRSCQRCFQLLEVVIAFNTTFHPFILEVTSSPNSERLSSLSDYLLEQNVLEDLAAMLVSKESTAVHTLQALSNYGIIHLEKGEICSQDTNICINKDQMMYLMDTRREQRASRNWIRLFPSSVQQCISKNPSHRSHQRLERSKINQHYTNQFEKLVVDIESYFLCPLQAVGGEDRGGVDSDIPIENQMNVPDDLPNVNTLLKISSALHLNNICDNDANSLPYLSAIHIQPYIQLYPEFSALTTEYQIYVNYSTILIQIQGVTKHCGMHARLEDKHDSSRWANFSLGVGENIAHILVVDINHEEPYIVNAYKLTIYRQQADGLLGKFEPNVHPHEVCSIKQDCSLPWSPSDPCGLQPVPTARGWNDFMNHHLNLSQCGSGSVSGQWVVPCSRCSDESSCYWNSAVWQPPGCREGRLSTEELKSCLANKKILFIGDSTNRGILHYIVERLNGSLMQWDKTHNIRIYPDLVDGSTVFGFAYYPQFWLPSHKRPMFDKALSELTKRTLRWSEKKDTILVLGGVHWLAKHHIDVLIEELHREGLSRSQVIVKGLGAGFHQPVSGVHQLSQSDQLRLSSQNTAVLSYAEEKGFSTVDTFGMTMARYRDFLQGKCACHFHKVSPVQSSVVNKLSHHSSVPTDHNTRYHVEGDINTVYSEMVINRICSQNGG